VLVFGVAQGRSTRELDQRRAAQDRNQFRHGHITAGAETIGDEPEPNVRESSSGGPSSSDPLVGRSNDEENGVGRRANLVAVRGIRRHVGDDNSEGSASQADEQRRLERCLVVFWGGR
jgi:hypothetical protein